MSRKPATPSYDAAVLLEPRPPGEAPRFAFALVKFTYTVTDGGVERSEPEPLLFDVYGDDKLEPRFPPGSDYWVSKAATDVVVRGSAYAPEGRPTGAMSVSVQVGRMTKRVAVFGNRELVWRPDGRIEIPEPQTFIEMPLGYENAYGGMDPRVPLPDTHREAWIRLAKAGLATDHPGLYPRNPIGKGYLVYADPIAGLQMPNLEDPHDLLTAERLVVGSPELWYRQPLPWCFAATNGQMYPRELYAGFDAWFPCNDDEKLAEVQRGFIPPRLAGRAMRPESLPAEYYQEASLGMVMRERLAGQPVAVSGMHQKFRAITFNVPAEPFVEIEIDRQRAPVAPSLTHFVISPSEKKFVTVYCARSERLPRAFIPGIHKEIPISISVDREAPIPYEPPPTIHDRLQAARSVVANEASGTAPTGKEDR